MRVRDTRVSSWNILMAVASWMPGSNLSIINQLLEGLVLSWYIRQGHLSIFLDRIQSFSRDLRQLLRIYFIYHRVLDQMFDSYKFRLW